MRKTIQLIAGMAFYSLWNVIPGEPSLFKTYGFKKTPLATNYTRVIPPRIAEMRDNEAGHIRIFQSQISNTSIKPGPCEYNFGFENKPDVFLTLQVLNISKSTLMAVGQVGTRHNVWSLIDVWNTSPFSGPSDTAYPYANRILDSTNAFIVPGSCPRQNPEHLSPRQNLPPLAFSKNGTGARPGSEIQLVFSDPDNQPQFDESREYYVVFYHGLNVISLPFDTRTNSSTISAQFDSQLGVIIVNVADQPGAPTEDCVVAGPLIILEQ
ncbi:uncharacterized protein BDW43DRAFT_295956 [Aspergillus alliaceus]|uniref:uncharacterized protein n=1 Tax=Petromyces alliaceus TaxID=209559 RepID=UPI0012A5558B|nr:uncharacterized protein BDW43DRAFT_295956 [Aspergillus alliaceus]KAB8239557.1 hypothetical protein BDW43DRAFT_295956 [Aspergillus alliaceus]